MKKKALILTTITTFFILLCGIQQVKAQNNHTKQDFAIVYNSQHKKVTKITSHKSIDYLSNLLGELGGRSKGLHKKAPREAKISYHYVLYSGKHEQYKIHLYVYPKIKKVRVTHIPILYNGVWEINQKQFNKLNNPRNFN